MTNTKSVIRFSGVLAENQELIRQAFIELNQKYSHPYFRCDDAGMISRDTTGWECTLWEDGVYRLYKETWQTGTLHGNSVEELINSIRNYFEENNAKR